MVQDVYDSILNELGKILNIQNLKMDAANTCLVKFANGLLIYLEPYEKGDFFLISTSFGEMPPGRYRENVFREALKENTISGALSGTFAFKKRKQELILFVLLPLREISGEKIAAILHPFMEKALMWKNALANGALPQTSTMKSSGATPSGLFGLHP